MFLSDRNRAGHDKRLTIASEVISYAIPSGKELVDVYVRVWCTEPWRYRIVAADVAAGRLLGTTIVRTWDEGQQRLEQELRDRSSSSSRRARRAAWSGYCRMARFARLVSSPKFARKPKCDAREDFEHSLASRVSDLDASEVARSHPLLRCFEVPREGRMQFQPGPPFRQV